MRIAIRRAGIVISAVLAAVLLAFTTATSAIAGKVLMVGGLEAGNLHDEIMKRILAGRYAGDERINVDWPAEARPYTGATDKTLGESVAEGTKNLETALAAALASGQHVTVVGMSAGSLVVDEVLRKLDVAGNAPAKGQLDFMVIADSSRQQVIDRTKYNSTQDYTYQPPPDVKYDIVTVTGEYDGLADFPDRWWNLTAVVNAYVGALFVHIPVMFADLSTVPDENITTTTNPEGGMTKHYLVPTAKLPIVQLLPFLAPTPEAEAALKARIDRGYSRNDDRDQLSSAADQTAPSTLVADASTGVEPADEADEVAKTTTEPAKAGAAGTAGKAGAAGTTDAAADVTDGNKVSPTTKAGTSSKSGKPGDKFRSFIKGLFTPKAAKPSKTETPASDTTGSDATSSTSSSTDSQSAA